MMPNDFGIYLHDTPKKEVFADHNRWISNGCIRLEDAQRLADWLMGGLPKAPDPDRPQRVDLPEPVPVYITYLTAAATPQGVDVPGRSRTSATRRSSPATSANATRSRRAS